MIPKRFIRSVPEQTTEQVEQWWKDFQILHPPGEGWEFETWRDPVPESEFQLTSHLWEKCSSGAQKAGLIRLEALWTWGGIWVDSDIEPYRSFEPLLATAAFAAWEDRKVVPDAVIGAEAGHAAIGQCLELAMRSVERDEDAWYSGPGVTTAVFPGRSDVLILPPGAFYTVHYQEKEKLPQARKLAGPWSFAQHHWHGSWLPKQPPKRRTR